MMKPEPSAMRCARGSVGAPSSGPWLEEAAQELVEGRLRRARFGAGPGPGPACGLWSWS